MQQFISDYTGLGNRLETLVFAYLIRETYGHQINLDWPELDSFRVEGTRRRKLQWYHRINCLKIRPGDDEVFSSLGKYRNLSLRSLMGGPPEGLDRQLPQVVRDLRVQPRIVQAIEEMFAPYHDRPVVAVHLRRGDFPDVDVDRYDATIRPSRAVPDWWFQWAMNRMKKDCPDVRFYLSFTGQASAYAKFTEAFDCFYLKADNPYTYKGAQHASMVDPVADLFALACCPLVLASPISSFSHWAINVLGEPAIALMPPPVTGRKNPLMVKASFPGQRLPVWFDASRKGLRTTEITASEKLPAPAPPRTAWLKSLAIR